MEPKYDEEYRYDEEYIGKLPEFQEVSKLFGNMLIRASRVPNKMNPNIWPENKKICQIFKKFFGLKDFCLHWIPSDVRNAFTVTDSLLLGDYLDDVIIRAQRQHGRGFYDTEHSLTIVVFGYCGILLKDANMTGAELTAIFLHEIGHNFDYSPITSCCALRRLWARTMKKRLAKRLSLYQGDAKDKDDTGLRTQMTYDEYKQYLYDSIEHNSQFVYDHQIVRNAERKQDEASLKFFLNSKLYHLIIGINAMFTNALYVVSGAAALMQLCLLDSRKGEQFADSMSTAYGYGPELVSGLEKLMDYKNLIVKNHLPDKLIRDYCDVNQELMSLYMDEHGSNQARAKDCIIKLESDLKSGDYPPEMKKAIMEDLERLRAEYRDIVNCTPELKLSMQRGFRKFVNIVFGGRLELQKFFKRRQM